MLSVEISILNSWIFKIHLCINCSKRAAPVEAHALNSSEWPKQAKHWPTMEYLHGLKGQSSYLCCRLMPVPRTEICSDLADATCTIAQGASRPWSNKSIVIHGRLPLLFCPKQGSTLTIFTQIYIWILKS